MSDKWRVAGGDGHEGTAGSVLAVGYVFGERLLLPRNQCGAGCFWPFKNKGPSGKKNHQSLSVSLRLSQITKSPKIPTVTK